MTQPEENFGEWAEQINLVSRLAAAERVCRLYGLTSLAHEGEREKATMQAWSEWYVRYGRGAPRITDEEIADLAAKRDMIRDATLLSIRAEYGWGPDTTAADFEGGGDDAA